MSQWQITQNFRRYVVGVKYDGSHFSGWQSSKCAKLPNVYDSLVKAITEFIGEGNISNLKGSSRTDAGVHALRNCFQVDLIRRHRHTGEIDHTGHTPHDVMNGVNFYLSNNRQSIYITDVREENSNFDVRLRATSRTYQYYIICPHRATIGKIENTRNWLFHQDRAWLQNQPLDVQRMQAAAVHLLGENDFSSFRSSSCVSSTPIRHLMELKLVTQQIECGHHLNFNDKLLVCFNYIGYNAITHFLMKSAFIWQEGSEMITITITANSFLQKMVRNIVATLVQVGKGRITPENVKEILELRNRAKVLISGAPAHGLYLVDVGYDPGALTALDRSLLTAAARRQNITPLT